MSEHFHRPLDPIKSEIRLLTLQPGAWNEDVICTLQIVSLNHSPRYEALSYVWGDMGITREINLDGNRINITQNLFYALRRLRYNAPPRIIWADAICINQADDVEKSHQVAMMSKIFSLCEHAVLWLGEDPDLAQATNHLTPPVSARAQRAFEFLRILAVDSHLSEKPCFRLHDDASISILEDFEEHFEDFREFTLVPWWTRAWVLQESALPPVATFCWASETCSFEDFNAVNANPGLHANSCCRDDWITLDDYIQRSLNFASARLSNIHQARGYVQVSKNNTLSALYRISFGMQATQSKDLFYGLFGMVNEWGSAGPLTVDYTLTDVESLARAFVYCIRQDRSLQVLLSYRKTNTLVGGLTWFPHFIYDPEQDLELLRYQRGKWDMQGLSSSSSGSCDEAQIIDDSILVLVGTRVDCIASISTSLSWEVKGEDLTLIQKMNERMHMAGITAWPAQPPVRDSVHDVFWRSMIHDCVRPIEPRSGEIGYRRAESSEYNEFRECLEAFLVAQSDAVVTVPLQFWNPLVISTDGSRMLITDDGRLGFGQADCEVGDEIWILNGSNVPHILRPSGKLIADPESDTTEPMIETHEMIGEAYVHGLMYHQEHPDEVKALESKTVYLI